MPAEAHVSGKETTVKAHPHKVPPGPRVNPLSFLSSLLFGSPPDLLGLYTDAARDYGDVVRFPGGPLTSYFFNHPDHIKHVLQDNNHNYPSFSLWPVTCVLFFLFLGALCYVGTQRISQRSEERL